MRKLPRRKPRTAKSIRKNCLPLELERLETRWLPAADLRDSLALALAPPDAGPPFDDLEADLFAVDRHHRPEGGGAGADAMHHSPGGSDGSSGNASPSAGRQATSDPNAAAEMNAWQNWVTANNPGGGGPNRANRAAAGAVTPATTAAPTGKTGVVPASPIVAVDNAIKGHLGKGPDKPPRHDPPAAGPLITGGGMTLSVLDMNNGIVLSPSVPTNDFSTYPVKLDADVQGDTVSSYSWDTSHASDAQNVSGSSTYRLTFNWLSFSSGVRTDTISVTATGSSHNTVTGTFTFLVASTGSPAYSSTPPTNASTWLSLLPPDAVSDQQAMTGLGPYYQVGSIDGELRTTHGLPAYNPNVPGLQLVYVSTTANIQPIFDAHYQLPPGVAVPGTISGQLTFNGTALTAQSFIVGNAGTNPPLLNPGDTVQLGLLASNAQSLSTGRYSYSFQVVDANANPMTSTYSGSADILNYKSNAFGAGWNLIGLERIFSVSGGVILDLGDGQSLWFANGQTSGSFVTPPGDFSTLSQNTTTHVYTRLMPDGTQYIFNSSGYQTSVVDRNNNTTAYSYNASNQLTSIQDFNSQLETFAYSAGGNVTTITDPANRVATLAYDSSGRLTSVTDADGSLWTYAYDSLNNLTQLTNPLNNSATFAYSHGRVYSATRMDGSVEQFNPVQLQSLAASAGNTPLAVPATEIPADLYTDPNGNVSSTYVDWLGFGQPTVSIDPLNNTGVTHRDLNGLAWMPADGLGNRYRDFFDGKGNVTTHVQPDDTKWQYTYNIDSEVVQTTDPRGNLSTASYDSHGNDTQFQDPLGNLTSYTYTSQGLVSTTTDPRGNTTTYFYDSLRRLTAVEDPLTNVTTTLYDSASDVTGSIDPRGDRTTYSFDALGRQTRMQDALANVSTTLYDKAGNSTGTIDQRGDRTTYSYDKLNRQTQLQDALGDLTTTLYDKNNNVTTTIDARGDRTTFSFDASNRQTQLQDALGHLSTTLYDAAGNRTGTIDARGDRTTYSFDSLNRQTQVQDALGDLSTTLYDQAGNASTTIDPLNHRTTFSFDSLNRRTQVQDALGNLSTTVYDQAGNVTSKIDALGARTTYSFDALNRQTQVQDALGDLSTTVYDQAGNVTATIDARGDRTTFAFDQLNRQTALTDPLNHTSTTVYDAAGNVTQRIDAAGFTTTYSYDKLNRQTTLQDAGTGLTTTVYDVAGNVTSVTDQMGHTTTYQYDQLNRRTTVQDARGGLTTTVYDSVGNVTNIIDPVGNKTTFVLDALNRQTQMTDPLGNSGTTAYDAASRVTSTTDRDGRVSNYSYDQINRETGETWLVSGSPVNTFTFSYDAINRLTAANSAGTYTMTYDKLDRMTAIQEPFGLSLTYSYDAVSNRTLVQDSLNGVLTSVYDQANRLTSRQFGGTSQTPLRIDLTYTPRNQISGITRYKDLGGTQSIGTSAYSYDGLGRLTHLQHANGSGSNIANYTYSYDLASRLTQEQDNGTTTSYGYDATNELTSAGTTNYSYDVNGNRTMTGYQTGTGNELLNDGTWTYSYDPEGNMTKKTKGSAAETWYFSYDNRDRLISAKQEATDGGTLEMQATYVYDALGNRAEKDVWTSSGGLTVSRFGYDQGNVWADLNSSNQLQVRRLSLDAVDSVFTRISSSGTVAWYLPDHLGSIRDIADNSGNQIDHIDYDAFGNVTNETQQANGDRYKWTGRELDTETGLQYNRARYYGATVGRWTTQDPMGFAAGDEDLYRYVTNSPLDTTDPSGLSGPPGSPPPGPAILSNTHDITWEAGLNAPPALPPPGGYEPEGRVHGQLLVTDVMILIVTYDSYEPSTGTCSGGASEVVYGRWKYVITNKRNSIDCSPVVATYWIFKHSSSGKALLCPGIIWGWTCKFPKVGGIPVNDYTGDVRIRLFLNSPPAGWTHGNELLLVHWNVHVTKRDPISDAIMAGNCQITLTEEVDTLDNSVGFWCLGWNLF